jgi:CheY-like chemotaxis protein
MEVSLETDLSGTRVGLLGFPEVLSEVLGSALKSAGCLPSNLPTTCDDPSHPWEGSGILIVWAGEDGATPSSAELAATSQPWLLLGPEEVIRQNPHLYLPAADVVFTPYSSTELLFRIHRMIHRSNTGGQYSSRWRKPSVLIADDDPAMLRLLEAVLRNSNWECHFAANGREALMLARKLLPDLLVLDVEMPLMTGLEVLKRIREQEVNGVAKGGRVKVLLLTASSESKQVEEGWSLGADDYLAKPFSHITLVRRVMKLLSSPSERLPALKKN